MFKKDSRYITRGANEKLDLNLYFGVWLISWIKREWVRLLTSFQNKKVWRKNCNRT